MKRDPGLQPERTAMSWIRTALLTTGVSVLLIKVGRDTGSILIEVCGIGLTIVAFGCFLFLRKRFYFQPTSVFSVKLRDYRIKQLLSLFIAITAACYLFFTVSRLLALYLF